ncbi:adenosylmethionine decarboxylase [candidate division KSB1 bacterium]|nr:adenosylmethionine decarboxylase [candidate division KSB1 bacterium]NIR71284.1 adenosylmethionine decarboxylase [candidate division KSB1 bacterium]NIS24813.1 adenosylmethionine decarboxylase [candidate division KSB1 bacterium]NIT71720.1 adenosylmethionine decarboxylase [candidate division KSB1 bacterium]NIU25449.1 adenosylmethionine decarboxylase [candidate division KSB1 bacterium]
MKTSGIELIAELNGCSSVILNDEEKLKHTLTDGIVKCGLHQVSVNSHKFQPIGVTVISIINESHIAIHTYPEAHHASVDIFHCSTDAEPLMNLLDFLKNTLNAKSVKFMEVSRGQKLEFLEDNCVTSPASYGFEVRYHFKKMLLSKNSRFHKIEVVENENFGRMMFLDGDLQIAEKDVHVYNDAMVTPLVSRRKLGNVAILGGGDGGVLNELLKYQPKHVTLVDIDEDVISISKQYFKMVCSEAFEQPNVRVIVGDATEFLENHHDFDAVIYDLTMDPELSTKKDKQQFLSEIFSQINASLKSDGLLSMQCCSEFNTIALELIRNTLSEEFTDCRFKTMFIPSYCEPWVFGTAVPKNGDR